MPDDADRPAHGEPPGLPGDRPGTRSPALPVVLPVALPRAQTVVPDEDGVEDVVLRLPWLQSSPQLDRCPMCGVNAAGPLRPHVFTHVPRGIYLAAFANTLLGALLYFALRRLADGALPLCDDCYGEEQTGSALRTVSVLGLILFPAFFAAIGGWVGGLDGGLAGIGVGGVAGLAGMHAARTRTRAATLECRAIDRTAGTITLHTSRQLRRVLEREAPHALVAPDRTSPRRR